MCGICGVVQVGGPPREVIAPETLDAMTDAMTHRGPNDRGTFSVPGVAFGVRRLSIVDVDGGHQPFSSEDRRVVAMQNGEIYNHLELRTALVRSGHAFRSQCDTEILPHLYEEAGLRYPERLRGIFATAVWDAHRRRTVIARDQLGVKPLYFSIAGDLLVFASELKSLLASGMVDTALDYDAIDAYLTFGFFPGPQTPLAAVEKLLPGHRLVIDEAGVRREQYWAYPGPAPRRDLPPAQLGQGLLERLEESVRLQLMSDVPLGAMLSGGLDSSLIVALMARNMGRPVKTFSVGFVEDGKRNELADARLVAKAFGTDHHELQLSVADQQVDMESLVWFLDEPLADLSSLGFLALSKLAASHVTVALSGQGADELLGGYAKHQAAAIAAVFRSVPAPLRKMATSAAAHGPRRIQRAVRTLQAGTTVDRLLAMSGQLDEARRRRLFRGPLSTQDGQAARRALERRQGSLPDDPLPSTLYVDAQLALVDDMLHYFDRASMAHSLEVRVPFLDHHLVEYCATIPAGLKVRRGTTKYLLKEAARPLLPARIIDKPKIGFFAASVDGWFQAQTDGLITDRLLSGSPRYVDFLDRAEVAALVRRHRDGSDTSQGRLLLAILMLELWLATFLPRAQRLQRTHPAMVVA
ncbi:MAG TPA: asparagine synthase (glutamine-hydrolyzing) [Vicinamibacterales bacterium]|nr:asparagine synthase (glutamine-hydrolyzing) [Vicinamibacterales bacterium]